jgi:hypothetical protein
MLSAYVARSLVHFASESGKGARPAHSSSSFLPLSLAARGGTENHLTTGNKKYLFNDSFFFFCFFFALLFLQSIDRRRRRGADNSGGVVRIDMGPTTVAYNSNAIRPLCNCTCGSVRMHARLVIFPPGSLFLPSFFPSLLPSFLPSFLNLVSSHLVHT